MIQIQLTVSHEMKTGIDPVSLKEVRVMQVKYEGSDHWENFLFKIQGFEYVEGNEYILKVLEEKIDFMQDWATHKYTLIEIIKINEIINPPPQKEVDF